MIAARRPLLYPALEVSFYDKHILAGRALGQDTIEETAHLGSLKVSDFVLLIIALVVIASFSGWIKKWLVITVNGGSYRSESELGPNSFDLSAAVRRAQAESKNASSSSTETDSSGAGRRIPPTTRHGIPEVVREDEIQVDSSSARPTGPVKGPPKFQSTLASQADQRAAALQTQVQSPAPVQPQPQPQRRQSRRRPNNARQELSFPAPEKTKLGDLHNIYSKARAASLLSAANAAGPSQPQSHSQVPPQPQPQMQQVSHQYQQPQQASNPVAAPVVMQQSPADLAKVPLSDLSTFRRPLLMDLANQTQIGEKAAIADDFIHFFCILLSENFRLKRELAMEYDPQKQGVLSQLTNAITYIAKTYFADNNTTRQWWSPSELIYVRQIFSEMQQLRLV